MPKTSSIRATTSTEHRLVTDTGSQQAEALAQGRSRRSSHGLTTFSVTKFFKHSLPFKVIAERPPPLRQHIGTTWPDQFSKADYDPIA